MKVKSNCTQGNIWIPKLGLQLLYAQLTTEKMERQPISEGEPSLFLL